MDDVFTLKSSGFPETARVASFRGKEALSELFAFEVFVVLPGDDAKSFDLADAVGAKATLASAPDSAAPFAFHGIVATVELVHAHDRFALLRAVLQPRFSRLALTEHSRVFTQQSIPDILKAVFEENGLTASDYALQLTGSYAPEEHVCQYHESDFAFVSRWMEHLGIYYFFEHGDDAEKLIVTDTSSTHTDLPTTPVRYVPATEQDRMAGAAIESFRCRASSLPATVRLKDYDYTKPTLDVSASAPVDPNGVGEIAAYAGRFFDPAGAQAFAKLRAEELLTRKLEHFGGGTTFLRAGYTFTLDEHPMGSMNQKYLATACEHFGNVISQMPEMARRIELPFRDTYHSEVTAIPASVQYRPPRATPRPRIYGLEHGLIDGEQTSDYAQIDDHGRYKVKFFFDESDLRDGKASTWVRMMQPHGGGVEGFHFPLRKGTEVVVSFMGGDPDRPVIAGAVNTTSTPSPVTSGNSTRNVIQTGGRNRIEIEDKAGQERITISSPHANSYIRMGSPNDAEMHVNTDGSGIINTLINLNETVGSNMTVEIGGTLGEHVKGNVTETYDSDKSTKVFALAKNEYGSLNQVVHTTHTEAIGADVIRTLGATSTETIAGPVVQNVGSNVSQVIGGSWNQMVGGSVTQAVGGSVTQVVAGALSLKSNSTLLSLGPVDIKKDRHIAVTMGATSDTFIGAKHSANIGMTWTSNLAINLTTSASLDITYAAAMKATYGSSVILTAAPEDVKTVGAISDKAASASHIIGKAAWTCALWTAKSGLFKIG